jgi:hypothetical protein
MNVSYALDSSQEDDLLPGQSQRILSAVFKNLRRGIPVSFLTGLGTMIYNQGRINLTVEGEVGPYSASATLHLPDGQITNTLNVKSKPKDPEDSTLSKYNEAALIIPPPNAFDQSTMIDLLELSLSVSDMSPDVEEKIMGERINLLI